LKATTPQLAKLGAMSGTMRDGAPRRFQPLYRMIAGMPSMPPIYTATRIMERSDAIFT
jgi:hypothetical protein